jgi:hypothetical protein
MNRRNFTSIVLAMTATVSMVGCETEPAPATIERIDPAVCSGDWRIVLSPREDTKASIDDLQWHGDRLYFSQGRAPSMLRSISTSGSDARTIRAQAPARFWIEGDHITYVADDQLRTMPLEGVPPEPAAAPDPRDPARQSWALDRDALYWQQNPAPPQGAWSIWRSLRDGTSAMALGTLPYADVDMQLFPLATQLFVFSPMSGRSWVLAKAGGDARETTLSDSMFLGLSDDGEALWSHPDSRPVVSTAQHHTVLRQRLDGSAPEAFWSDKPVNALARRAFSDHAGGWYVSTWERDSRDDVHLTLWKVTAQGTGTRLACDPLPFTVAESAVVAPDGVYLVVRSATHDWQLAAVAR